MWFARYGSNSCSYPCKNCFFFTVLNKSSHKCEFTNSALTAGFFFIALIIFFEIMAYLLPCAVHLAGNGRYMHHTYINNTYIQCCHVMLFNSHIYYIHTYTNIRLYHPYCMVTRRGSKLGQVRSLHPTDRKSCVTVLGLHHHT